MRGLCIDRQHGAAPASMGSWSRGGASYDPATDICSLTASGQSITVLVPTMGASTVTFLMTCYSDVESPRYPGLANAYVSSSYYAQDKATPAYNASSPAYTGNGNAALSYPLGQWSDVGSSFVLGPNIAWLRFSIVSAAAYQVAYKVKDVRLILVQ